MKSIVDLRGKPFKPNYTTPPEVERMIERDVKQQGKFELWFRLNELRKSCGVKDDPGRTIKWRRYNAD